MHCNELFVFRPYEVLNNWRISLNKINDNFRNLRQERLEQANPRQQLTSEETKRLNKLETMAEKLMRGENIQNRQLQKWRLSCKLL